MITQKINRSTIVKIDRNSINRNPRAHSTRMQILGAWDTTFKVICKLDEFKVLEKNKNIVISQQNYPQNGTVEIEGHLINPDYDYLKLPGKWEVESNRNVEVVNHLPESEWLYKYEPTKVKCENCRRTTFVSLVETDCNDEGCWTVCPNCNGAETFDYEFEDIYTVVKEMKL